MLMMHRLAFDYFARRGTLTDGLTVKEEPMHKHKSDFTASSKDLFNSFLGNFYPK